MGEAFASTFRPDASFRKMLTHPVFPRISTRISRRSLVCAAAAAATLCAGWAHAAGPLQVVASFSILGDVVREVGGDRVLVQTLIGPDQDAHVYQATPADLRKIRAARLVLMNGLGFEGATVQRAVQSAKVPMAEAARGIATIEARDDDHDHGRPGHAHGRVDPHVWNNPVLMQRYAQNVADALMQADPDNKAYYARRLSDYQKTLRELDAWAAQQFAAVPVARRKVLTGHDAFGYMAQRYQVQFIAPQGISTEGEASARAVARIIQQVRKEGIRAVFVENIRDPRLVQQLARETGVQAQKAPLYSDALSSPQGPAASYVNLVRHNVGALVQAMR